MEHHLTNYYPKSDFDLLKQDVGILKKRYDSRIALVLTTFNYFSKLFFQALYAANDRCDYIVAGIYGDDDTLFFCDKLNYRFEQRVMIACNMKLVTMVCDIAEAKIMKEIVEPNLVVAGPDVPNSYVKPYIDIDVEVMQVPERKY